MYEFKKLSDVELLSTVPDGATVLAEVDGVIRRVPSNGLESGSSDPPEFNLTDMGLPALTMDGSYVSVECDTTELRAALAKNAVKLSFTANIGSEVPVTGIVNAFELGGTYQCGFVGYAYSAMLLSFEIGVDQIGVDRIIGRIIPLTTT